MKWNIFILTFFSIILLISLTSATQAGYNYLNNQETTSNTTTTTNNYYNQTVNATVNDTQFDSNDPITIKESWLTSFINAVSKWANYYTKTEIDNSNYTTNESALAYVNSTGYVINWSNVISGGSSANGTNGEVQFANADGSFGADSNFVWDNTNKRLGIGVTPSYPLDILMPAAATRGINIDGTTNPLTASSVQLLNADATISGTGTTGKTPIAINSRITNSYSLSGVIFGVSYDNIGIKSHLVLSGAHNATFVGSLTEQNSGLLFDVARSGTQTFFGSAGNINNFGVQGRTFDSTSINKAGSTLTNNNYGGRFSVQQVGSQTAGTLIKNNYGVRVLVTGNTQGTTTNYGLYVSSTGADTNWAYYNDGATGDNFFGKDNVKSYLGTAQDASIYYDGSNMVFNTSVVGSGLAYFSNNVSATGFVTRTSVYDKTKGTALDLIKDADELKTDEKIDHKKFYGYTQFEVTDFDRPEIEEYDCSYEDENMTLIIQFCNRTIYPHKKLEDGVELGKEIDVLRQGIVEYKEAGKPTDLGDGKKGFDTDTIFANEIYTKSKVPEPTVNYCKMIQEADIFNKENHYAYKLVNGRYVLDAEYRWVVLEGCEKQKLNEMCLESSDTYSWCPNFKPK